MNKLVTLYKKSSRNIEEWKIWVEDHTTFAEIHVEWGLCDGKKQKKMTKITSGKNQGKSNETDCLSQAIAESISKHNKQKDKGYTEDPSGTVLKIMPMLAKVARDHWKKIQFPCYVSAKLDGLRLFAVKKDGKLELQSRLGKPILTMGHIEKFLQIGLKHIDDIVLDGELYCHGWNFQRIISAVKRDVPSEDSPLMELHLFDIVDDKYYKDRYDRLHQFVSGLTAAYKDCPIKLVQQYECSTDDDIFSFHKKVVSEGYEGSMVRNNTGYEIGKRTHNLLKLKDFQDAEFEVIGGELDKNQECIFHFKTDIGAIFKSKSEGTHEERIQQYKDLDKMIGKKMTVKFFEWSISIPPVPRFPIARQYLAI